MRNPLRTKPARRSRKARAAIAALDPDTIAPPDLRAFTVDFFNLFGGEVTPLDKRKQPSLRVRLPEALAAHFGEDELLLAFQSVEAGSGQQLVAHGSRTFDRMLAFVEKRSALTVRRLPARHTDSEGLMRAVRPRNAGIANLRLREQPEPRYAFHWRITYRADDKREELYTVVLDEQGALMVFAHPLTFEQLLAESEPMPPPAEAAVRKLDAGNGAGNGDGPQQVATGEATEDPPEVTSVDDASAEEEPLAPGAPPRTGPRLPPMTQLVRSAETARKFAVYHADLRCAVHEAEIMPRLFKALNRLTTYYGQQIEEMRDDSDPNGEKRVALEADLDRKRAEEIENHRLHVRVELCGYAIVYLPTAVAEMTLTDGAVSAPLRVRLDRYTGAIERPLCHACGSETEDVILCRNGHVACDACTRQCAGCGDVLCAACGVESCPVCGRDNCDECGSACLACGSRACADHQSRCPICGDAVCHACQAACDACGVRQCRSHLRADAVPNFDGSTALICATCAVRCPGCNQYSAHMGTCSISGQRFCDNCLVSCRECGQRVGFGFYVADHDGAAVCKNCVVTCPSCGAVTSDSSPCATCGASTCTNCGRHCAVCGKLYCQEHSEVVAACGHVLCHHHAGICHIGLEPVCTICAEPCAICESTYCTQHQSVCRWCGRAYCSRCVGENSGLCLTCGSLLRHGEPVDIAGEPCSASGDVQHLAHSFIWRRAINRDMAVYAGTSTLGVVLVVARTHKGGKLAVITRKLSPGDVALGYMQR